MRFQTDLEFRQNEIKKLNKKYVQIFSSRACGGKAYAAEQNIREFKKFLFWSKRLHKATSAKRFDSRKLIRLDVENMNSLNSQKYGYTPNAIEEKAVDNKRFRKIYNSHRLVKVKQHAEIHNRTDVEKDKKLSRELREPLKIGGKVLALAERLKKKDASGNLYKSTTENISFFNHELVFIVREIVKISNIYHYWISKEAEDKVIDKRFLRQELYALNLIAKKLNQFLSITTT